MKYTQKLALAAAVAAALGLSACQQKAEEAPKEAHEVSQAETRTEAHRTIFSTT